MSAQKAKDGKTVRASIWQANPRGSGDIAIDFDRCFPTCSLSSRREIAGRRQRILRAKNRVSPAE
jgi:hypothetical protein